MSPTHARTRARSLRARTLMGMSSTFRIAAGDTFEGRHCAVVDDARDFAELRRGLDAL
jgi:hypothetical protein